MQQVDSNIAILGGGCIGTSIFHALGQLHSKSIVLVDDQSSESATQYSGGLWRVFHENSIHTQLALSHFQLAKKFKINSLLHNSGSLYIFNCKRMPCYQASLALLEKNHYPFELFAANAARQRFPEFIFKPQDYVLFEPLSGRMKPHDYLTYLENKSHGQKLNEHVHEIICTRNAFHLITKYTTIHCRYLILAGGYRLIPILRALGISFTLTPRAIITHHANLPKPLNLPFYFDRETLEFAAGNGEGELLFGASEPTRFKNALPTYPIKKIIAYDCYAPNRLGYLGSFSHLPRLYLATGWGGTGFKFSLAIGEKLAKTLVKIEKYHA